MSKHKFKIGDRVIAKGVREIPDGATGTVIEYSYRPLVAWDQAHKCTFKKRGHTNANVYAVPEDKIELIIKTMDTVEKNGKTYKATEREDGSILLEPITPLPKCKARCGDVYTGALAPRIFCGGYMFWLRKGNVPNPSELPMPRPDEKLLLNIFDFADGEYVKKQDIIDALSHKDEEGDTLINFIEGGSVHWGRNRSLPALRKLGIIED